MITNKERHELVGIALKALYAVASMTPMPKRHYDLWMLAINRVHQTETEVVADEQVEASRRPMPRAPAPTAAHEPVTEGEE